MPQRPEDDTGSLEKARTRLYEPKAIPNTHSTLASSDNRTLPHAWEGPPLESIPHPGKRRVHLAGSFFIVAFIFFFISLAATGYLFFFGGNSVSIDKIFLDIQGPTTIAGGDTVPLSLTITNRNPVAVDDASIEISFPNGTRNADDTSRSYPRYTENLGTLESGETVTRSIKAVIFGGAGQTLTLPIAFSYRTSRSTNAFVKKSSYALAISSTPLSVSVDTQSETVSGKPLSFTLAVRSNATVPLENVVLTGMFPFGFSVTSSSEPLAGSSFLLGTLQPGASRILTLAGTLTGQNNEERVFRFTVGTAKSKNDQTLAINYMTQDATVTITAPFITTTLALNGDTRPDLVITPESRQSVSISYTNTLSTSISNAAIAISLSGSAVDYSSIETTNGFYRSSDRTIIFSRDTDPSLATLAPGASGVGSFTFSTLSPSSSVTAPSVTFTVSVSGTRVGQSNVPEQVNASLTKTVKVATAVSLTSRALHTSGLLSNTGPIPPRVGEATTYSIVWDVRNSGSSIADGVVSTTLPSYVSYTGITAGAGSFSYDSNSRVVTWKTGDLSQSANTQGAFQVSFTPSDSQRKDGPTLTGRASFSGYDRFAGVQISTTADPVTTETRGDPGYSSEDAIVQ